MTCVIEKRPGDGEDGFTLIELMIVLMIIANLLAIAVPTFLGVRDRANDRAAQASVRNALTAAKVIYADGQDYRNATVANLLKVEPGIQFMGDSEEPSENFRQVAVFSPTATNFRAAAMSKTGTCWEIEDELSNSLMPVTRRGTHYGVGLWRDYCIITTASPTGDKW